MYNLILASGSRYRQQQLAALGIRVQSIAPEIDETPQSGESPIALCQRLADQKAQKIAAAHSDAVVIGSDQVALIEESEPPQVLGKPHSHDNAVSQLNQCSGRTVSFYTAVSVHCLSKSIRATQMETTRVVFRALTDQDIERYLLSEKPYDCAGSFKSEGRGILLFEGIESRDPNALIGLPVMLLRDMLGTHVGIDLLRLATD